MPYKDIEKRRACQRRYATRTRKRACACPKGKQIPLCKHWKNKISAAMRRRFPIPFDAKKYREEHKDKAQSYKKVWAYKNRKRLREKWLKDGPKFWKKRPYMYSFYASRQRCNNKNHGSYKWYGGRGIKFLLSQSDVEFLWNRDKASSMKCATIDRIDNNGNYEVINCRFMEKSDNLIKSNKERRANTLQR